MNSRGRPKEREMKRWNRPNAANKLQLVAFNENSNA